MLNCCVGTNQLLPLTAFGSLRQDMLINNRKGVELILLDKNHFVLELLDSNREGYI
jgi:hypothetical protein